MERSDKRWPLIVFCTEKPFRNNCLLVLESLGDQGIHSSFKRGNRERYGKEPRLCLPGKTPVLEQLHAARIAGTATRRLQNVFLYPEGEYLEVQFIRINRIDDQRILLPCADGFQLGLDGETGQLRIDRRTKGL